MSIITISRGTFSGGQMLAEHVADKLGYRCIAREVLLDASKDYGVTEEKLFRALTGEPGFFEHFSAARIHYMACIRAELLKEIKDEKVVYHGHAGHLLLAGVPNVLRIRVIANMEYRIKAAMKRHNLGRAAALKFIEHVDEQRSKWTRILYHVDWMDPQLYDLVINLDHITISDATDLVCEIAGSPQFNTTPESQKDINDLILGTHLSALIATHNEISEDNIDIMADGTTVTVKGTVGSLVDADRIRTIVRQVPGVGEIHSEMSVRLPVFGATRIDQN